MMENGEVPWGGMMHKAYNFNIETKVIKFQTGPASPRETRQEVA